MARHHLIEQHAVSPPVHPCNTQALDSATDIAIASLLTWAVGLVVDDLRGDILRCPAKCPGARPRLNTNLIRKCQQYVLVILRHANLAEPEVRDLDVPLLVEHHVVQLEVPVEHPVLVQIQQRDADLRSIKPERVRKT